MAVQWAASTAVRMADSQDACSAACWVCLTAEQTAAVRAETSDCGQAAKLADKMAWWWAVSWADSTAGRWDEVRGSERASRSVAKSAVSKATLRVVLTGDYLAAEKAAG